MMVACGQCLARATSTAVRLAEDPLAYAYGSQGPSVRLGVRGWARVGAGLPGGRSSLIKSYLVHWLRLSCSNGASQPAWCGMSCV